jgi:hypothetical protein
VIYIITGHYGSGKTNIAVNLALERSKYREVTVVDLDIVNYYFRTADFKELFEKNNIKLISSEFANSSADIPSIGVNLEGLTGDVILDVGGDDEGAKVLGVFDIKEYVMYYVFNRYRYMTQTPAEALDLLYEIETVSKLKHTALINNSNLGDETTPKIIEDTLSYGKELSEISGLPLLFTSNYDKNIDIFVKKIWED